jgi:hypothetical protein
MIFEAGNKRFITRPSGTRYWYLNGLRHRDDGPALIWESGTCSWYEHDIFIQSKI